MIYIHALDPVAFELFGWPVRWYGLAYIGGFFVALWWGWRLMQYSRDNEKLKINNEKLRKKANSQQLIANSLPKDYSTFESLAFGMFVSGVIGGRLGHFLFFRPGALMADWTEVFRIWQGGMSIQGGFLCSILYGLWYCWRHQIKPFVFGDHVVMPLALALGLGRVVNFVNGELVGKTTDGTWGVIFPHFDELPRHVPVLYEALGHFLVLGVMSWIFYRTKVPKTGFITGLFFLWYGVWRFFVEYTKLSPLDWGPFTSGQVLCMVMVVWGGWVMRNAFRSTVLKI